MFLYSDMLVEKILKFHIQGRWKIEGGGWKKEKEQDPVSLSSLVSYLQLSEKIADFLTV